MRTEPSRGLRCEATKGSLGLRGGLRGIAAVGTSRSQRAASKPQSTSKASNYDYCLDAPRSKEEDSNINGLGVTLAQTLVNI